MNATELKPGDKVTYPGVANTEWMPIRPDGYKATVKKIFKNGKVRIEVQPEGRWICKTVRTGCLIVNPVRLTPRD